MSSSANSTTTKAEYQRARAGGDPTGGDVGSLTGGESEPGQQSRRGGGRRKER